MITISLLCDQGEHYVCHGCRCTCHGPAQPPLVHPRWEFPKMLPYAARPTS